MKLKNLIENTQWQNLSEKDFKSRVSNSIIEMRNQIHALNSIVDNLIQDVEKLKQQAKIVNNTVFRTRRQLIRNQPEAIKDDSKTK